MMQHLVLHSLMLHWFNSVKLCYFACLKHLIGQIAARPIARQEIELSKAERINKKEGIIRRGGCWGGAALQQDMEQE